MSPRTLQITDALFDYLRSVSLREPPILARLRAETAALGDASRMQLGPEQGQFMALLAELMGPRRILELGTFTGYSSLAFALAVPDARIVTCDVNAEWTALARRFWTEAGVADRVALHLGPAAETLEALRRDGQDGAFDLAFIDADKENYRLYYEHALALLRPGGLVMIDNVLWGGRVIDPAKTDPDTEAIRALNAFLRTDQRVALSLVPIGDGLTLAVKRR